MSHWNEVVTLLSAPESYQDSEGGQHEGERVGRTVFCSPQMMGTLTMAQLRSSEIRITNGETIPEVGLRKMAIVMIRTSEYNDEDQVIFQGKEMDVIGVTAAGENSKLLMRERLGNDPVT